VKPRIIETLAAMHKPGASNSSHAVNERGAPR
jgi:hypothetical protein